MGAAPRRPALRRAGGTASRPRGPSGPCGPAGARRALAASIVGAVGVSLLPSAITAQEATGAAADTLERRPPAASALPLAPITVTVTRTESRPLLLPFAVAALEGGAFRDGQRGISLEEALRAVPGVTVHSRRNFALDDRISVRGAGSRAQFGVRGVRVLLDGIPLTMPDGQTALGNLDPASLGRAEIVRGPAAAMYGNAAAGVLSFQTREPPAPLGGGPRLLVGSHGLVELRGEAGGREGGLDWSAAASRLETDGFREHARAEVWRGSGLIRTRPGEGASLTAAFHVLHTPFAENPSSLELEDAENRPRTTRPFVVAQGAGKTTTQAQAGISAEAPAGGRLRLGGAAWGVVRDVWNPIVGRIVDLDRRAGGGRVEVLGTSSGPAPRLRWTAGLETETQRDLRRESENLGVGEGGDRAREGETVLHQRETVLALGPFAQGELRIAPRWLLTLAARWDRYRFGADDRFLEDGDDSGSRAMSRLSPAAGIVFLPDPRRLSLYANLSTSFQTPTMSELSNRPDGSGGFDPDLGPERTTSLEAGLKAQLPAPGLAFDLALYRANVSDALVPFEGPTQETFFRNAGESDRTGVETGLAWRSSRRLELRLAYAWQRFRFEEFVTEEGDFSGRTEPGVPEHALLLSARVRGPGFIRSEVDVRWTDAFPVNDANTAWNPSWRTVDLRFWVDERRTRLRPFLGVDNLFGERYNGSVVPNAFAGRYFEPAPGLEVYGGISLSLGGEPGGP